jgi:hypothetical protein
LLLELELELELEFELEFELELLLELLLEFELELELEFELWLELEFELELELWFELEFELWLELELELVLLLWFELEFELWFDWARSRLIVRRLLTARARHHWMGLPSIFRSTTTLAACVEPGAFAVRAALSSIGAAADPWSSCDRAESGSRAAPTARPSAPNAPA